ncbi:hypothetical protein EC988_002318 [Linderina pennispora]|nr:hypothetical protein EC988_002318 [Linderina pennispora]
MLVAELLTPARSGSTCTDATQPLRSLQPFAGVCRTWRARSHHLHKTLSISIRKPTSSQRSQHLFHVASTAPGVIYGVLPARHVQGRTNLHLAKHPHTMWLEIDADVGPTMAMRVLQEIGFQGRMWEVRTLKCYVHHSVGGQYTWSRNQTSRAEQLFETVKRQLPELQQVEYQSAGPNSDIFPIYNGFRKVMTEPALTALTLDINGRLHDFAMLPLTTAATLRSLVLNNITLSGFLDAFVEITHTHRRTRTLPVAVFAELEYLDIHLIHVSSPGGPALQRLDRLLQFPKLQKLSLDPAIGRAVSLLPAFHASPLHTLRLLNTDASLLPFDQRDFPRLCSLDVALRYLPSHELHTLEGLPQALLAHSNLRHLRFSADIDFQVPQLFACMFLEHLELGATVASDAATEIVGQLPFLKTLAYQIDAGRSGRRLARQEVVEMVAGGLGSTPLNMRLQKLGVVAVCYAKNVPGTCFAEAAEVLRLAARVPSLLCLEMGHGRVFGSLKVLRDALGDLVLARPAGHLQHLEIKSICV